MAYYKNILLVDDDKDDQEFFIEIMQEVDSSTTWTIADNGKHALTLLSNRHPLRPDFILLDIYMPVMDGFEFLGIIKNDAQYKHIPVVVLSTSRGYCEKCYEMGACLYIVKPTSSSLYRAIILDLLSRDIEEDCDELRAIYEPKGRW
jgi:CheY-like chemotaxis protein